jgi:subtilisin family serine protease
VSTITVIQDPDNVVLVGPSDPPLITVVSTATTVVDVVATGPQGPDPWDEPIQEISASGALVINYSLGKHVVLTLTGNVTSLTVSNWPASQRVARLTLEILNNGAFTIQSWPGVQWPDGVAPGQTPSGKDMIILTTVNAGARTFGHLIGLNYL